MERDIDRRRALRIPADIYSDIFDEFTQLGSGKIINISTVGVALETESSFSPGSRIILNFTLEKRYVFKIKVEIVWNKQMSGKTYLGCKFIEVNHLDRERLRLFVEKHHNIKRGIL